MFFRTIAEFLFKEFEFYIWLLFCTLYALYCMFFIKPILFSGIYLLGFSILLLVIERIMESLFSTVYPHTTILF
uniref:Uncharacterized protein n=1 Tax=Meloidogyne enterolobii TaxID=390850 RepID=A0A6V7WT86_MELEN|nr:unnamed protein product [Meloidogyne enterolobii]